MREIMFRGMRKDGVWVYGYYQKSCDNGGCYSWINDEVGDIHDIDPVTVGQYTGLKDKNGKEIYEGDVLNVSNRLRGVVEFKAGSFIVQFDDRNVRLAETLPEYDSELIGNIYDNPELLEGVQ